MTRLVLEYLLHIARRRGELHRQYGTHDPNAVTCMLMECAPDGTLALVTPEIFALIDRVYREDIFTGRFRLAKQAIRPQPAKMIGI